MDNMNIFAIILFLVKDVCVCVRVRGIAKHLRRRIGRTQHDKHFQGEKKMKSLFLCFC
jgi:hypothetical protein